MEVNNMPSPQVLQPVLKMKVDELFLNWLSEPTTQTILKDYLGLIKSGQSIDLGLGDTKDKRSMTFNENNNVASKRILTERSSAPLGAPSSPPSTHTLPSGSSGNARVVGPNGRALRRSVSTKKAQVKSEAPVPTALSESIPKFYFPRGRPKANLNIDGLIAKIEKIFSQFPNERATIEDMGKVAKACECPLYWKAPLFNSAGGDRTGFVSVHKFVAMWRKMLQTCHDDVSKFVHLLAKPGCNYLEQEDFIPFLQDVVNSHAGLAFLKEASDFHSRYITTVSHYTYHTKRYFEVSVDLARHNDQAISHKMIERIFSGTVTRDRRLRKDGRLSYADFVWFLISEEDKKTDTSIEYWFRCMDLDGDGVLSMYELEYFYEEQCVKLETMAIEPLPFEDCLCQMLDLVKPEVEGKITLRDLKQCKLSHIFYDTFFNIEKYLDHEQKDPFSVVREAETEGQEISDWEKYAAEEYDILVAEETTTDQYNDG
uniref:EF-hand domain-containing protein n=1 Tax=Oncorhynchus tshawytscha TaxID=74940 RepID=A0AAZ3RHQ3_ONCTS